MGAKDRIKLGPSRRRGAGHPNRNGKESGGVGKGRAATGQPTQTASSSQYTYHMTTSTSASATSQPIADNEHDASFLLRIVQPILKLVGIRSPSTFQGGVDRYDPSRAVQLQKQLLLLCREGNWFSDVANDAARQLSLVCQPGFAARRDLRQLAWPVILGCNPCEEISWPSTSLRHKEYDQVELDIQRSFPDIPRYSESHVQQRLRSQKMHDLSRIVNTVLVRMGSSISYYQGFHDVCSVFLDELHVQNGKSAAVQLARGSLHWALGHNGVNIAAKAADQLHILALKIAETLEANEPLKSQRMRTLSSLLQQKLNPFVTVSWSLTWFSHSLSSNRTVAASVFDVLLAAPPCTVFYLCILVLEAGVQDVQAAEDDGEAYGVAQSIPEKVLIEPTSAWALAREAADLLEKIPPSSWIGSDVISLAPSLGQQFSSLYPADMCGTAFFDQGMDVPPAPWAVQPTYSQTLGSNSNRWQLLKSSIIASVASGALITVANLLAEGYF